MTGDKRALLPLLLLPLLLLLTFCQQCNSIRIPPQLPQPPIITEQTLENYTVFPTDDIVLKCEATGEPMPIFRWTKDGTFFDPTLDPRVTLNTSSGTMVIATSNNGISFRGYQGTYRCYASNDGGTAVSSKINLKTESTPKWPKESVQQFGKEEGESLVLQCNPPTSMASAMIIWMTSKLFNINLSERVSQGLDGNLYFSNLLVEDSLEDYTCYAQLPGTRTIIQKEPIALEVTTSNSVRFRKPRLLHPRGQSSPRLALRDRPLHLECIAEGLPTPTVHWERLDGNLPGGRVSYENFNKTLTIHHVAEEDDGEYRCIVINGQGRVTHTFSVTVEAAPYWVRKPQDGVYGPGENVLLDCDVDAKPKAHIRWSVNGVPLNETDSDGRRMVTGSRVVLTAMKPEDTAVYQCLAENRHGKLLANIIVQVIELPTQILTPSDLEYQFVEKQTAYIHCKAFGAPTPKIAWSKEDMTTVLQDVRYFQYTNGTLRIVDVQEADAGGYTCNASNGVGTDSLLAALDIKNASQIVEAPRDQHVQRLHAATFSCVVEVDPSLPPPSLQWSKDGQTVDEADDDDSKYHIREGLLKVKSVGYEDEGMYKCEASSLLDSVTASAQLIVVDYPDPPFDLQVDGFTAREALLSWTPGNDHNSPIERFLVEFEEDLFEPGIWQLLQMVEGDHHEAQLDLSPYVNYSFRVVAVNRLGHSEPSPATQHYMTPPAAPEKNPEGVKGEGSHPSNMIITWQVLKGLDWNGPGLQYEVKWRRQDVEDEWKELVVESPPYLVNATPTFVPYQIQVQAINEEGSAPEPHTVIGYSGEDYPLHSPKSVTVENVSSSSVRVKWTRVPTESLRGLLRGYNISYWEHQSTGRHHQVLHGDHNHALIKELKPYTTYDLEVRVFNSKGESPLNDTPYQFITPEGVPSKPTLLQLELLKDTEVTASWHPPRQPNGIITGYVLHYQQINGTVSSPLREQIVPSPDTSRLTVHDLQPHAFYHFHVLAETVAGRGPAASRDIFTSQEGEPRVLKNISHLMGDTHTNFSWIGLDGHRVTELLIQYMSKTGDGDWKYSKIVNSSQNFFTLDKLHPGTPYHIRLWQLGRFKNLTIWDQEVETLGPAVSVLDNGIATQGWFIGLISAIVLLVLILLIICFIKRNKGGKYSVKDKEDAHVDSEARPMKDETFREYRDTMASSSKSEYFSQREINALKATFDQDGLSQFATQIVKKLNELKNAKLNIGVTGESGAGKSTFINAMRGMCGCDVGAAKIGVTQTTMVPTPFRHPDFPNVCFWDLPGVGTETFPVKDYVKKMEFTTYDFFIIISQTRFTENDAMIAKEINKLEKKFYFVRSKIDNDLDSLIKQRIVYDRNEKLAEVKQDISLGLTKSGILDPIIFLISSFYLNDYDFAQLKETLVNNLDVIKKDALLMSLPSTTVQIVEQKRAQLKKRIWMLATASGAVGAVPILGLSFAVDIGIIVTALLDFRTSLGLDNASLQRLANVANKPVECLKAEVTTPLVGEINTEFVRQMLLRSGFAAVSVAEMALNTIPIIGSIFGAVSSFAMTYKLLTDALVELVENVQRVVKAAFATDPSHPQ